MTNEVKSLAARPQGAAGASTAACGELGTVYERETAAAEAAPGPRTCLTPGGTTPAAWTARCLLAPPLVAVMLTDAKAKQVAADLADQRRPKAPRSLGRRWRRRIVDKAYSFREMMYVVNSEGVADGGQVGYKVNLMDEGENAIISHYTATDVLYVYAKLWAAPWPADGSRWMAGSPRLVSARRPVRLTPSAERQWRATATATVTTTGPS